MTLNCAQHGIASILDPVLESDPDRLALVAFDRRLTYAERDDQANAAAAAALRDIGVRPGDRVAARLPNSTDIVVAFHASMRLGAIWVGINQLLAAPEEAALLSSASPTVLLADSIVVAELDGRCPASMQVVPVESDDPRSPWRSLVRRGVGANRPPAPDAAKPAAIAYTSGTTGLPRGVVHSQANLVLPGQALVASRGYGADLRKGDFLPFTILNLAVLSTLLTSQAGGRCVLFDRRDAEGNAERIEREGVTVWNTVPALRYSFIVDSQRYTSRLTSLTEVWTGGADCPEPLRQRIVEEFGVQVFATNGLTEAPSIVKIDPIDGAHVEGASGVPLPHLDVRIRDSAGATLPPGVEGEITVEAASEGSWAGRYAPMLGYWGAQDAGGEEGANGGNRSRPLRTNHLGCLDENGYLFVRGRKNVVIVRGAANIYSAEVERVLLATEGVRGCAVMGKPDARLGERVVAVVEPEPGVTLDEAALKKFFVTNLAKYKVPDRIVVLAQLPRNSMGKVQRTELLALFDEDEAVHKPDAKVGSKTK